MDWHPVISVQQQTTDNDFCHLSISRGRSLCAIKHPSRNSSLTIKHPVVIVLFFCDYQVVGGSVAEWLACWTQAQRRAWVQIAAATLSRNSLRQTVHTHRTSVHQAAKLVAALLRIAGVTAGLAESNGSLPSGL